MSNPVSTYHGVRIYLSNSEYPACKELVIMAAGQTGPVQIFPGIVLDAKDMAELATLFKEGVGTPSGLLEGFRAESFAVWKRKVVREACERNDIPVSALKDTRRAKQAAVVRARAQAVRVLVGFVGYGEAGREVGISNHTSVFYWVAGRGKDRYK